MSKQRNLPRIPVPHDWPCRVKSTILHVISLAQFAMAYTRFRHNVLRALNRSKSLVSPWLDQPREFPEFGPQVEQREVLVASKSHSTRRVAGELNLSPRVYAVEA